MTRDFDLLHALQRHGVPFVTVGGHAVYFHGYGRLTEDTDVVWLRSPQAEQSLLSALTEIDARYIGKDIDPATGIERTYPVTMAYIQVSHLMMLWTKHGFLDLFDYIPGFPAENVQLFFDTSVDASGIRYASLDWLRKMKRASGRPKDLDDLEKLPEA
jgi:hypothetical protein